VFGDPNRSQRTAGSSKNISPKRPAVKFIVGIFHIFHDGAKNHKIHGGETEICSSGPSIRTHHIGSSICYQNRVADELDEIVEDKFLEIRFRRFDSHFTALKL
jgi:hypothetical protein